MWLTIKRRKGRTKQQITPYGLLYQQCFSRLVFGRCLLRYWLRYWLASEVFCRPGMVDPLPSWCAVFAKSCLQIWCGARKCLCFQQSTCMVINWVRYLLLCIFAHLCKSWLMCGWFENGTLNSIFLWKAVL